MSKLFYYKQKNNINVVSIFWMSKCGIAFESKVWLTAGATLREQLSTTLSTFLPPRPPFLLKCRSVSVNLKFHLWQRRFSPASSANHFLPLLPPELQKFTSFYFTVRTDHCALLRSQKGAIIKSVSIWTCKKLLEKLPSIKQRSRPHSRHKKAFIPTCIWETPKV